MVPENAFVPRRRRRFSMGKGVEDGGGGSQLFAFSPAWQEGMKKTVEKVHCFFLISACLSIRRGSRRGIRLPGP